MYSFFRATDETLNLRDIVRMSKKELIENINEELDTIVEISNKIPSNPTRDMGFDLKQIDETINYAKHKLKDNPMVAVSAMDKIGMTLREYGQAPYRDFMSSKKNVIKLADELKDKIDRKKKKK